MKKLFVFLLIFITLTACTPQKEQVQTEAIITSDKAVTAIDTDVSTPPITAEEEKSEEETDEILVRGQKFAEEFAEMYWNYLCGAAWEDYVNIRYIDFEDKSDGNYIEYDGMPFYKLLISEYTYDEAVEYIKSFYTEELYNASVKDNLIFIDVDNCIYVNGQEPNFIYSMRNEHAHITGYTENNDGTVTYDCYAKTTEEDEEDLYFSFTLNEEGKLCEDIFSSYLGLFSDKYY